MKGESELSVEVGASLLASCSLLAPCLLLASGSTYTWRGLCFSLGQHGRPDLPGIT
jgi:Ca2+/H+ antiporter